MLLSVVVVPPVAELIAVGLRLLVDLVALGAVLGLVAHRARGGRELLVAFVAFNAGLFVVMQVITDADLGVGGGLGLFAVLSIIRLRSELFTTVQLAYVFGVLALALATGVPGVPVLLGALLAAIVVLALAVADARPGSGSPTVAVVTLDRVRDEASVCAEVERVLGLQVIAVRIAEVDLVRETMRVEVTARPGRASTPRLERL